MIINYTMSCFQQLYECLWGISSKELLEDNNIIHNNLDDESIGESNKSDISDNISDISDNISDISDNISDISDDNKSITSYIISTSVSVISTLSDEVSRLNTIISDNISISSNKTNSTSYTDRLLHEASTAHMNYI